MALNEYPKSESLSRESHLDLEHARCNVQNIVDESVDDFTVAHIPLPNQIPPVPKVTAHERTQAPGTFDSVLNQNQDLMSRLSLALRHNLGLEKQVGQLIERNRYLELQAQALHSEMSQISAVNKNLEVEFLSIKDQRDSAERLYAEFHTEALSRIERMANQLIRFQAYKRKIRKRVRPALDRLKQTLIQERSEFSTALKQNTEMRDQLDLFKKQLSEAYARIQSQHTESEAQQNLLVETYESKLDFYIKELDFYKTEYDHLQKNQSDLEKKNLTLLESSISQENRAIAAERRFEGLKILTDEKTLELRDLNSKMTIENSSLRSHNEIAQSQIADLNKTISTLKEETDDIQERYRGLQIIWEKASHEAAEAQQKLTSLQRLNRDLSQALSERRHEAECLKEQLAQIQNKSSENLQSVYEHIKSFTTDKAKLKSADFSGDSKSDEMIRRIEALVTEAQSGPAGKLDL